MTNPLLSLESVRRRTRVSAARGFTLLELILVISILGIIFSMSLISLRGVTPKYRVRTAARLLGSTMENVRLTAISRGKWMGIHYDLTPPATSAESDPPSVYRIIPPAPDDYPDQPIEDRKLLSKTALPPGVRIRQVILAGSHSVETGIVNLMFSPLGNAGSHIVVVEGQEGHVITIKCNAITGLIEFYETAEEVGFQTYEE